MERQTGSGLARAKGPTPCYLKPGIYRGDRECSMEGWGWGSEVGAGSPGAEPAGARCQLPPVVVQLEPWLPQLSGSPCTIPPAWAPELTGNILPSLSIPTTTPQCSPPEQNVPELGSHMQPPLEPSIPFTTNVPGRQGSCPWWPPPAGPAPRLPGWLQRTHSAPFAPGSPAGPGA